MHDDLYDVTEFDEQSSSKERALALVYSKAIQYYQGDEYFGVLMAYERAAMAKGATMDETEAEMKRAKEELNHD